MRSRLLELSQLKNTIMAQHMPPNVTPKHEDAWMAESFMGRAYPWMSSDLLLRDLSATNY